MRFERLVVSIAGVIFAAQISVPAIGAERTVVGELFTATW